jgi:hypothetical protein
MHAFRLGAHATIGRASTPHGLAEFERELIRASAGARSVPACRLLHAALAAPQAFTAYLAPLRKPNV